MMSPSKKMGNRMPATIRHPLPAIFFMSVFFNSSDIRSPVISLLLLFHCCFFDVTSLQLLLYNNFFHCAVISVNFLVTHLLEGTYFYEIFLASF